MLKMRPWKDALVDSLVFLFSFAFVFVLPVWFILGFLPTLF